jgi:hypothetical protein
MCYLTDLHAALLSMGKNLKLRPIKPHRPPREEKNQQMLFYRLGIHRRARDLLDLQFSLSSRLVPIRLPGVHLYPLLNCKLQPSVLDLGS